jgi:hypothetical protein
MKLCLTEKQYNKLISEISENQEVVEQDSMASTGTAAAQPSAGTTPTSTGSGYPQVGKWESGVTRGPSNQIGVTKWSDVVGSVLKRGKSNQLK